MHELWPIAVCFAFTQLLFSLFAFSPKMRHRTTYFNNIFYFADIFGNAFTGGHYRVTVSARVGYFALRSTMDTKLGQFWLLCQRIIDSTFIPLDGPYHCYTTLLWTQENITDKDGKMVNIHHGSTFFLVPLLLVIIVACAFIWPALRLLELVGFIKRPVNSL